MSATASHLQIFQFDQHQNGPGAGVHVLQGLRPPLPPGYRSFCGSNLTRRGPHLRDEIGVVGHVPGEVRILALEWTDAGLVSRK